MLKLDTDVPYLVEQRNVVLIPTNGDYDRYLPHDAKLVNIKGHIFYAAKNTPELNSLLYAVGTPVPSPIFFSDYDWGGIEIYSAQAQMAALLTSRRRCYNLSALGAGKTIGSLLAVDWFIMHREIERALVVAPLSILRTVWEDEILKNFFRLVPTVLHGTKAKRLSLLEKRFWNVAIINHDGMATIQQELLDRNFGCVIIDEAAAFRDARTRRWGVMKQIVDQSKYVAALTGSPTPNNPSDAYGLGKLVNPQRLPKTFKAFRHKVEYEVTPNRWIARKGAAEIVAEALQPAVRFMRSDISEIKGMHTSYHPVELSPEQARAMSELKKEALVKFPEGVVSAVNAAVLLGKLLQICSGAVYTDTKDTIDLKADNRVETTKTLINAAEGKVIVLAPYIHTTRLLAEELEKSGMHTAMIMGQVTAMQRTAIFREFQDERASLRVIVAHPKVLAHGINLTKANTIIWYAPIFSRETYEQACGRIHRLGQTRDTYIIHLFAGSEERMAYNVLEGKGTMQDAVLAAFHLRMLGDDPTRMLDEPQVKAL